MTEVLLTTALLVLLLQLLALLVLAARRLLLAPRPCVVTLDDGRQLPAVTFRRLLPVLADAGIAVPAACGGAGTCGLCRVVVTAGGGEPAPTEIGHLGPAELRAGVRLACQVRLRGDLSVRLPPELGAARSLVCTLRARRMLTPFIAELVLAPEGGAGFDFRAGQFVQVTVPPFTLPLRQVQVDPAHAHLWDQLGVRALTAGCERPTSRAYSLANRPADAGTLVLNVRLALPPPGSAAPPGVVSSYLFGLQPGARLQVSGPHGSFGVRDGSCELVFIGGGAGMAPLRALLFDQLERVGTRRKLSFWYGARSRRDLLYADELDALASAHPNFTWTPALSEPLPDDDWSGATGFIHQVVLERHLARHPAPASCEYYLCGPPPMTRAVLAMLADLGVERSHIFNDDFG